MEVIPVIHKFTTKAMSLGYTMLKGDVAALHAVAFCAGSVDDVPRPDFDARQAIVD